MNKRDEGRLLGAEEALAWALGLDHSGEPSREEIKDLQDILREKIESNKIEYYDTYAFRQDMRQV